MWKGLDLNVLNVNLDGIRQIPGHQRVKENCAFLVNMDRQGLFIIQLLLAQIAM